MAVDLGTVLVADDEQTHRHLLRAIIVPLGYRVVEAENGFEALKRLHADPGIRLVLTDLMMPVMTGLELLGVIERSPVLAGIPVVQVTADLSRVDYRHPVLSKPFRRAEVETLVRTYARRS